MNKSQIIIKRLPKIKKLMESCALCPRKCGAKRFEGQVGFCKTANQIKIASWALHRGEEPPISGTKGSGAIFASGCTLSCIFCQNYPFSQMFNGKYISTKELGAIYTSLAKRGAHNLNFVTPAHVIYMLLEAVLYADCRAQELPIVYNCSGYESLELLKLLDGIVDVYLPDIKYADNENAKKLSNAPDYVEINLEALKEMYRQVGNLTIDKNTGLAVKGLIVRHLVLPGNLAGTEKALSRLKEALGTDVNLSLMSQYFPAHKAFKHPTLNRALTLDEYSDALNIVESLGFINVLAQDPTERGCA